MITDYRWSPEEVVHFARLKPSEMSYGDPYRHNEAARIIRVWGKRRVRPSNPARCPFGFFVHIPPNSGGIEANVHGSTFTRGRFVFDIVAEGMSSATQTRRESARENAWWHYEEIFPVAHEALRLAGAWGDTRETRFECVKCGRLTAGRVPHGSWHPADGSLRYPRRHKSEGALCPGNLLEARWVDVEGCGVPIPDQGKPQGR